MIPLLTEHSFFKDNQDFVLFGLQHLLAILFFGFAGTLLIRWARKLPKRRQIRIGNIFAFSLTLTIVISTLLKSYLYGFNVQKDLPLHLCNIMALGMPLLSLTRKKSYYEVLLFWVFAGTLQAIITPDLQNGFPHHIFLRYWMVHAGLVVFMLYATYVYGLRPSLKSVFRSFGSLQVYIVLMMLVNYLLGSNYFFTNRKPAAASALDYLGDWPNYILVVELMMIPYFLLIYLPFYLSGKKKALNTA